MQIENQVQPAVCRLNGISKSFGDIQALCDVTFEVRKGEFLAIVGENGAGKSTAMGVLFGLLEPDAGHITFAGERRKLKSARDAIDAGFGMVHQHFKLYPDLTVLENVLVGYEGANGFGLVPFQERRKAVASLIREFEFTLDLDRKISDMPVDARQQVEIVKMLFRGASVVILDEPTAVLTPQECVTLYAMLKRLCAQGKSVVLITHKLGEVMDHSERVLVMRHGALVAERKTSQTDQGELAELMVGRQIETVEKISRIQPQVVASLQGVSVQSGSDKPRLDGVSIELRAGEIFGVAGVTGNGQKELVNAVMGLEKNSAGQIIFQGRDIGGLTVAERRQIGIGYMAEDRMTIGLAARGTIAENLIAGREGPSPKGAVREGHSGFSSYGFLHWRQIRDHAQRLVKNYDIRTPSAMQRVGNLSGGNQQKVVVARELSAAPKLLVVENPCWGVDVGAISFIHRQILQLAETGVAILLISNDLEELFELSDRVGVMFEGRMNRVFDRSELDAFAVGAAMSGDEEQRP